jgi:hypothetical protein
MPTARVIKGWLLQPPTYPGRSVDYLWEQPSGAELLEHLRPEAELPSVGRSRFVGPLRQKNAHWLVYRNFIRQALSNFQAALNVENRSASLLYYYAMLNLAKAELLTVSSSSVQGFVFHGLRFNVSGAKTVFADYLTVSDGVFRMLYERRTGFPLPVGTRLPVKRLIARIPEIGEQVARLTSTTPEVIGIIHLVAFDDANAWILLALDRAGALEADTVTGRYFRRYFRKVDAPREWRDKFAVSRRALTMEFYESIAAFPFVPGDEVSRQAALRNAITHTSSVKDVLGLSTDAMFDAWLSPSLYKTRMLPMPPAMARYAVTFYASSLVRYRPSMFDTQAYPEQAYLFDALARECAIPMLKDTLSALTGTDYYFLPEAGWRV